VPRNGSIWYTTGTLRLFQQFRQLRDIDRDPPRLIAGQQLGCRPTTGLVLAIDEGQGLLIALTAFEVGLFAWMAVMYFLFVPRLEPTSAYYWFLMQIGMVLGFVAAARVHLRIGQPVLVRLAVWNRWGAAARVHLRIGRPVLR
jgi:hypothetical protein